MIRAVDASPDGQYFRVTRMIEPFSYLVPVSSFGSVQELWDANGQGDHDAGEDAAARRRAHAATPTRRPVVAAAAADRVGHGQAQHSVESGRTGPRVSCSRCFQQMLMAVAPGRGGAGRGGAAQRPQPTSVRYMSWLPPFGPSDTKVIYEGSRAA